MPQLIFASPSARKRRTKRTSGTLSFIWIYIHRKCHQHCRFLRRRGMGSCLREIAVVFLVSRRFPRRNNKPLRVGPFTAELRRFHTQHLSRREKTFATRSASYWCQDNTSDGPGRGWTLGDTVYVSASKLVISLLCRNRIGGLILRSVSRCKVHKLVSG